jgi:peptidoglycan/LPS O-acetylase OafA/YrhL
MVGIAFITAVLGAVLFWLVLVRRSRRRYGSGRKERRAEDARLANIAGLLLIGLGVGLFLIFAIAELAGGDRAGTQHFLPAAVLGALLWLGWRRPRRAGIILLSLALPLGLFFLVGSAVEGVRGGELWVPLMIVLPPVVAGWLLVRAGRDQPRPH